MQFSSRTLSDEAAGGSSTVKDGAAASVEEARRRFLPPMRPEASTPEGVYAASDIAGEEELEAMGRHIDRAAGKCQVAFVSSYFLRGKGRLYATRDRKRIRCYLRVGVSVFAGSVLLVLSATRHTARRASEDRFCLRGCLAGLQNRDEVSKRLAGVLSPH